MLNTLFKKKITDEQLATIFVNGIFEVIDKGFEDVKSLIKEDKAFAITPCLENVPNGPFTMIVLVANIKTLEISFMPNQQNDIIPIIYKLLAESFEMNEDEFRNLYKEYASMMSRVNHPSKVVLYSMAKAIFFKYELNAYQDEYFRRLKNPNPLFLKRMDEVMKNFIWNWDAFFKYHKVQD